MKQERKKNIRKRLEHSRILKRVRKGLAWVKERYSPDQLAEVDLEKLDMHDVCQCLLGQLEGSYRDAQVKYGLFHDQCVQLGFEAEGRNVPSSPIWQRKYRLLTNLWRKTLLAERKKRRSKRL
jgi:hypothetical protein